MLITMANVEDGGGGGGCAAAGGGAVTGGTAGGPAGRAAGAAGARGRGGGAAAEFPANDVYDEQIEVVEQCIEEAKEHNIVSGIKELIFNSPLPKYVPVLPPGFEVDTFYVCDDCGDRFAVESSYQFHRERRSILIRYDCPSCEKEITVYNRCNLLAHLRIHGNTSRSTFDWSRVFVSPLPFDKMLIGPLFNISEYEETVANVSALNTRNEAVKQCPECEVHFRGEIRDHFQGMVNSSVTDLSNKCKYCHMILSSKCSLKAHERYHRQELPYVCPDCGKMFSMWASFCVHLFYCCFHLDKCIRYRCPACKAFLPTTVSLEVHILTLHVKNVFKCNACPIACFSLQTLAEHKVKGHGHSSLPTNAYQQCQLCPDRLIPKARLLFHVIEHVRKPSVCVYGYQCSACKLFYHKKGEFAAHKSQCSEQSSNQVDIIMKVKNQNDAIVNQNVINGRVSLLAPSDITNTLRKDIQVGRTAMKTAACQTKTNGNHMPKDIIRGNNAHSDKFTTNMGKKTDEYVCKARGSEKALHLRNSNVSANNAECRAENGTPTRSTSKLNSQSLCSACGKEFITIVKNAKVSNAGNTWPLCANCLNEKPTPKRTRRSSTRSEASLKGNKKTANNTNKNDKGQMPAKRGKDSIALNGPNKKLCFAAPESKEKDKYKCHICRTLIGTEWEVIQEHFTKEHKNFNLLVLSPRINKIELGDCTSIRTSTAHAEKKSPTPSGEKKTASKTENKATTRNAEKSNSSTVDKRLSIKIEYKGCPGNQDKKACPSKAEGKMCTSNADKKGCSSKPESKVSSSPNEKKAYGLNGEKRTRASNANKRICPSNSAEKGSPSTTYESVKVKIEPEDEIEPESEPPEEPKSKRPRRKMPPRGAQNISPLTENDNHSLPQGQRERRYSCFKCKFQSNAVDEFWTHVVIHKTDSRAYQCMECGMCFVVKPSFQKHLFISHKIKDVDKYIRDHELCHQKPKKETRSQSDDPGSPCADETEELEENQCRVCKNKFETSVQLNKHFRTHGMAFLMMKQQEIRSIK